MDTQRDKKKEAEPVPSSSPISKPLIISLAGDGDLVDVRFTIDQAMSKPGPFYLQDEATGTILRCGAVPKIGQLTSLRPRSMKNVNNTAYALFFNPDYKVKSGSLVTFMAGEFKREHITVV